MAIKLTNPWVGYAERSFLTIKQSIIDAKNDPITGIPELTDDSEGNPFIKEISIWSGLTEQLGYYLDNKARNSFLLTTRRFADAVKIVRVWDYRIRGVIPSTGSVTFTSSVAAPSDIDIPAGTVLETSAGVLFETVVLVTILTGQSSIDADVRQRTKVPLASIGTSDGSPNQKIGLTSDVADNTISILVNGVDTFTPEDTFAFSFSGDKVFVAGLNEDGNMEILFGDGVNGEIPGTGLDIEAEFFTSLGVGGDVSSNAIDTISSVIPLPGGVTLEVINPLPTTNGTDAEGLVQLKKNLPIHIRSAMQHSMITDFDHKNVPALAPGVTKAGFTFDCGLSTDHFIVPNGGGIASDLLISDTLAFLSTRKAVFITTRIFSAGQLLIGYNITVNSLPTFFNADTKENVENALLDFHDVENQEVSGSIALGDIYEVVEGSEGVKNSKVISIIPIPYARPLAVGLQQLDWTRVLKLESVKAVYQIRFNSNNNYKLLRDNVLLGNFDVGVAVSTPDIDMIVNVNQNPGDFWEFTTYPTNDDINMDEPSLPATDISLLTITVTGGLS